MVQKKKYTYSKKKDKKWLFFRRGFWLLNGTTIAEDKKSVKKFVYKQHDSYLFLQPYAKIVDSLHHTRRLHWWLNFFFIRYFNSSIKIKSDLRRLRIRKINKILVWFNNYKYHFMGKRRIKKFLFGFFWRFFFFKNKQKFFKFNFVFRRRGAKPNKVVLNTVFLKKRMKKFLKRRIKILQQSTLFFMRQYILPHTSRNYLYDLKFRFSGLSLHSRITYIKRIFRKKKFTFFKYFMAKIPRTLIKLNFKSKQKNCFIIPQLNVNSKVWKYMFKNWKLKKVYVNKGGKSFWLTNLTSVTLFLKNFSIISSNCRRIYKKINFFFSRRFVLPEKYYLYLILANNFYTKQKIQKLKFKLLSYYTKSLKSRMKFNFSKRRWNNFSKNFRSLPNLDRHTIRYVAEQRSIINTLFFNVHREYRLNKKLAGFKKIRTWYFDSENLKNSTLAQILISAKLFLNKYDAQWCIKNGYLFLNGTVLTNSTHIVRAGSLLQLVYNKFILFGYFRQNKFFKKRHIIVNKARWIKKSFFFKTNKRKNLYLYRRLEGVYLSMNSIPRYLELDFSSLSLFVLNYSSQKIDFKNSFTNYIKYTAARMYNWRFLY